MESIFEFDDKFGVKNTFDNWVDPSPMMAAASIKTDQKSFKIEKGPGWKGSSWERVYKTLRKKSKVYVQLLTPYDKDKKYTYVLQSTNSMGNADSATASTSVNLLKYDKYPNAKQLFDALEKNMKSGNFIAKLHVKSDFFNNKRNQELNDLGRAINLIHEAVHTNLHYNQTDFQMYVSPHKQHNEIRLNQINKIKAALKEYDSKLSKKELLILSMSGLTAQAAGGDNLIIEYAKEIRNERINLGEENKIARAFEIFKLDFQKLTESKYENK